MATDKSLGNQFQPHFHGRPDDAVCVEEHTDPECSHERTQLMYVGAALEEHWCLDCPAKIRVWSASP